jgi:hypothetical protein
MPRFIDAWRIDTGQKLEHRIPDTWIRDGVNPNLTDTDPSTPEPAGLDEPTTPKEV